MRAFMLILGLVAIAGFAKAQGSDAHGGDPLRSLFLEAKIAAAHQVYLIESDNFFAADENVRRFVTENRVALAEDIALSPHHWVEEATATCARTGLSPEPIQLSFPTCRIVQIDLSTAIRLLIHESVHHFGFGDEQFADNVADAINRHRPDGALGRWQQMSFGELCQEIYCVGYSFRTVATADRIVFYDVGFSSTGSGQGPRLLVMEPQSQSVTDLQDQVVRPLRSDFGIVANASEVFMWGGAQGASDGVLIPGGIGVNPITHVWRDLPVVNAPPGGTAPLLAASDEELFVWGGKSARPNQPTQEFLAGAVLDLEQNTWLTLPVIADAVEAARFNDRYQARAFHVDASSDSRLHRNFVLVRHSQQLNRFIIVAFRMEQGVAEIVQTAPLPTAFNWDNGVYGKPIHWMNGKLIYIAHRGASSAGGIWDPASDSWTILPRTPLIEADYGVGSYVDEAGVLVWGGFDRLEGVPRQSGAVFSFAHQRWFPLTSTRAPSPRAWPSIYRFGNDFAVFGGTKESLNTYMSFTGSFLDLELP